jgi:predicted DCC family thiol-disulfide oxidoreductase YuxK
MLPRSFRPTIVPGKAKLGTIAVLFDGNCKLCRASVEAVRMYDNSGVVDLLDIHDEEKRALFPGLEMDALMEEIHVVDEHGRVWRGARAINEILRRQHGLPGILAYLWYLPGFPWLADRQYKRIARRRYGLDVHARAHKPTTASEN